MLPNRMRSPSTGVEYGFWADAPFPGASDWAKTGLTPPNSSAAPRKPAQKILAATLTTRREKTPQGPVHLSLRGF